MREQWRPITEFQGRYEVSQVGRVRRAVPGKTTYPGRILSPGRYPHGYLFINVLSGGRPVARSVHRLVAIAFLGRPRPGEVVNHKNGKKDDNRASNLEWTTQEENIRHAVRTGLTVPLYGESTKNAKLTKRTVLSIVRAYKRGGWTHRALAARYHVHHSRVADILSGRGWHRVTGIVRRPRITPVAGRSGRLP